MFSSIFAPEGTNLIVGKKTFKNCRILDTFARFDFVLQVKLQNEIAQVLIPKIYKSPYF